MNHPFVKEHLQDDVEAKTARLLREAEQCVIDGQQRRAETLFAAIWAIASDSHPDLANSVAWDLAVLLVQRAAYDEAARWFGRISEPPAEAIQLWNHTKYMLVQLCMAAGSPADPAGQPARQADPSPLSAAPCALPILQVTNLGRFQVTRGGAALPACKSHHATAIFRFLLSRRHRTAHKEELMELLWPDAPPERAAHSLHVAVSMLRRYLNPASDTYLLFEGRHYLINPDAPIEDDCRDFERLCDTAERSWRSDDLDSAQRAYVSAAACYRGDYVVDERDLPWALGQRERLLARYLTALDRLGQIFMAQACFEAAIEIYQRLLERDEYREDVHYQVMRCYQQLGRRGDARRQYERCAAILASDLGLEPMPEMRDLYLAVITPPAI